jgi:hypothetical protein
LNALFSTTAERRLLGAGCFAAQAVVDFGGHHLMHHDAVTGEHHFDDVARREAHDHMDSRLAAGELLCLALAVAFAHGLAMSVRAKAKRSSKPNVDAVSMLAA